MGPWMRLFGAALLLLGGAVVASAQDNYPSRPVRLVVPYPPGGTADLVSRVFAQELSNKLGQPIVIENRGGATGRVGSEAVMRSAPDGYTLLTAVISSHGIAPALSKSYPFDPTKDFVPVIKMGGSPVTLIARRNFPASTVGELIAFAKANPGKVNFASAGPGSVAHLAAELLKQAAGIEMTHVPYRGDAPAVNDLMSETVDLYFAPVGWPIVQGGRVKLMGTASPQRSPLTPDWPTLSETGAPGFVLVSWTGIMAPAGTPPEIVRKLNALGNEVLAMPAVRKRFADMAYDTGGGSPADFGADIKNDLDRFRHLNEKLNITME